MLYMVTFTINIPPMLAYIPYMDPMGYCLIWPLKPGRIWQNHAESHHFSWDVVLVKMELLAAKPHFSGSNGQSQPNFPGPPVLCYDSKVPATLHSSHALSGTTGAGSWCFMQWGTYFGVSGD